LRLSQYLFQRMVIKMDSYRSVKFSDARPVNGFKVCLEKIEKPSDYADLPRLQDSSKLKAGDKVYIARLLPEEFYRAWFLKGV
jgi:hypothetical protein